jgi:hypothetical protein
MTRSAFRNLPLTARRAVKGPKSAFRNQAAALSLLALAVAFIAAAPAALASPPPALTGLDSTRAYACGERYVYVYGTDIQTGATVRLRQAGQADRVPLQTQVIQRGGSFVGGFIVRCRFNLGSGTPGGLWSVVLTNPDAQTATLPDALEIVPECPRGRVGDLYACNVRHGNILEFDGQTGEFVCIFAVRPAGLDTSDFQPFDLAWAPNGNLWVVSTGVFPYNKDSVVEYDGQTGAFVGYVVPPDPAAPCDIGMSFGGPHGNLYVQDKTQLWGDQLYEYDRLTHACLGVAASPSPPVELPQIVRFTSSGSCLVIGSVTLLGPSILEYDATTFDVMRELLLEEGKHRAGVIETPDGCCYLVSEVSSPYIGNNVERFDIATGELLGELVPRSPCLDTEPWHPDCNQEDPCFWDAMDGPVDMAYGPNGHLYVSAEYTHTEADSVSGQVWGNCSFATGAIHEFDPQTGAQIRVFGKQVIYTSESGATEPTKIYKVGGIEFKPLPGDWGSSGSAFQGDWVVDEQDFARFAAALDGSAPSWTTAANLQSFDFDHDNNLDLADFAGFQRAFGTRLQTGRGACCNSDGTCTDDVWKPVCSVYLGDGSTCSGGGCPAFGACCNGAADGTCFDLTESECIALGDLYQGDDTQCATAACPSGRYRNEVEEITTAVTAGTGLRLADDLTLEGTGARDLTYLDLSVYGNGGGAFNVTVELWTACPGSGGTLIPGTTFTWNSIPDDSYVYTLRADPINPPVTIPDTVWMVATFSTAQAGWIIADQAEIGTTANTYARNNPWTCSATITNHHAGLWANLQCIVGESKAASDGQSQLRIERIEASGSPLVVEPQ